MSYDHLLSQMPSTNGVDRVGGQREEEMRARFLTIAQLRNLPKPEWLLENIIPDRATGMVFGKGSSLKTFLVLAWALSIAEGLTWEADGPYNVQKGDVIYVAGEGAWGMPARVAAWEAWNAHQVGSGITWYPGPVNLFKKEQVELFARAIEPRQPNLIVFDTLAKCAVGADENQSKDMGIVHDWMGWLNRTFDCGSLVIHHNTKDGDGYRGSSALFDNVDWAVGVKRSGDEITVKCEKQKDAAPFDDIVLQSVEMSDSLCLRGVAQGGGATGREEALLELLCQRSAMEAVLQSELQKMAAEALDIPKRSFYRLANGLVERGWAKNVGTEKQARLKATFAGKLVVCASSANPVPSADGTTGSCAVPRGGPIGTPVAQPWPSTVTLSTKLTVEWRST